jgi:DNA-binding NarL/FixJ family response regulator
MIKIVIIDNRELDRNNTQAVIASQDDFTIVGIGKDGFDALKLIGDLKPDIAILDICLDVIEGTDIIPLLKGKSPATAILFLTALEDEKYICKAVSHEVRGYLLKSTDMAILADAVRLVHQGGRFINPKIDEKAYHIFATLLKTMNPVKPKVQGKAPSDTTVEDKQAIPAGISRIELKIMLYVGKGHSTKEIAEDLCLTTGTVRNYLSSAMQKAGLQHRIQVPLFVFKHGLMTLEREKNKPSIKI